jgi:hypothetical protein
MVETLDFDKLAEGIAARDRAATSSDDAKDATLMLMIREALILSWNARGAADIVKVETVAADTVLASPITRALRNLDR